MQIKSELKYLVFINKLKYLVFINKSLRKTEKNEQRLWTGNSDRKGGRGSVRSVADRRAETGPTKAETFRGPLYSWNSNFWEHMISYV